MPKLSLLSRGRRRARILLLASASVVACSHPSSGPSGHESAGASSAALSTAPTLSTFVLYAQRSITLQGSDIVSFGGVGVAASAAPGFGPQLQVGPDCEVQPGPLVAPSVSLGLDSQVGPVETASFQNHGGFPASVSSLPTQPLPLFPLASPPTVAGAGVTVHAGHEKTLHPGSYGALQAAGSVILEPGSYTFSSVTLGPQAQLLAPAGGVQVLVGGSFAAGAQAMVAAPTADGLAITVAGNDDPSGSPAAATFGFGSVVTALLSAPHGTIDLVSDVVATGAFAAFDIQVGPACVVTLQAGLPAPSGGQQQLSGYITPEIAAAPLAAVLPATTVIQLAIGLPSRDPQGLTNLIAQLYDPTSPQFGKYLSPGTFAAKYGTDPNITQAIVSLVNASGLTVTQTSDDNQVVDVKGSVASFESLFSVTLSYYQRPDGSLFFAPDREPSFPVSAATAPILRVDGLDNFALPLRAAGSGPVASQTGVSTYIGYDFRNAYVPGVTLDGTGQSVALVEFDGFVPSDIAAYESASTPKLPNLAGTFVHVDGYDNTPSFNQDEVTLDITMAIAMAPNLDAVYSYAAPPPNSSAAYSAEAVDVLKAIASPAAGTPLSNQISCSWYNFGGANVDLGIERFAAQGQSFFFASGDRGAYGPSNSPRPPYDEPSITFMTVVGGTQLFTDTSGNWQSETTWNDQFHKRGYGGASAGGVMPDIPMPPYQTPMAAQVVAAGGSATQRNLPDVSFTATDIYQVLNGAVSFGAGTSASAPLWAGFMALVNQQRATLGSQPLGFANNAIYSIGLGPNYGTDFHDINDSSTDSYSGTPPFSAVGGYDLATGWGSPGGASLINDLAGYVPACPPGQFLCGSACVDLTSDVQNCGACGNDCTTKANVASATCVAAACVPTCNSFGAFTDIPPAAQSSWLSCPGDDGACSTPPDANPNCGACGVNCSTLPVDGRGFGAVCSTNIPISYFFGCEYPPGPNGP